MPANSQAAKPGAGNHVPSSPRRTGRPAKSSPAKRGLSLRSWMRLPRGRRAAKAIVGRPVAPAPITAMEPGQVALMAGFNR